MTHKEEIRRRKAHFVCVQALRMMRVYSIKQSVAMKAAWQIITSKTKVYCSKARGVSYGKRQLILKMLTSHNKVKLNFKREPGNRYDKNAVRIEATVGNTTYIIGYLAASLAEQISTNYSKILYPYNRGKEKGSCR